MVEERVSKLEGAYEQVDERLGDLTEAMARVDTKVDAQRAAMDARFDALRSDMDARFDAQRAEMVALRSDMDARFDAQRADMAALRSDMDAKFDAQRAEMAAQRAEMTAFRAEVTTRFNNMVIAVTTIGVAMAGAVVFLALRV